MRLIGSPTSPYTRKVRIVLAEKRIECEFVVDNPFEAGAQVTALNPLGKVPVLVTDDGVPIFDSRVIVEHLDGMSPVGRLIPEPSRQRVLVRRWEALADGILDAAVLTVLERRRTKGKQSAAWIDRQLEKVRRGLAYADEALGERPWCWNEGFSLADIALGCALGYVDLRFPELDWREDRANLARHAEKLNRRPSFEASAPPQG
jgi:glutathione S-transferase